MELILNPEQASWSSILKRPTQSFDSIESSVAQVFEEVQRNGDKAIRKYSSLFDNVSLDTFLVSEKELEVAETEVSQALKEAILLAKNNIEKFHQAQKTPKVEVETTPGVTCWREQKPIEKVGLYIPGGTAPLFSTVLMLTIPAMLAGCKEIVLCTPPNQEGTINPAILYTAKLCGIERMYKIGGIQAIAAMSFGTESVPKVYKIFGPGNQYVTVAKQFATKFNTAIDMPAGPSELLVLANEGAKPAFIAADLLSQAEHGVDSQVLLVSTSKDLVARVQKAIKEQLEKLPRKEIIEKAIANSKSIVVENDTVAIDLINTYGPEHLIICTENEDFYLEKIHNAGSVFVGDYTPESAGDYASGTNHTLPTNGYAKQYSGVDLMSFMKSITYQKITPKGLQGIGPAVELMAEAEGLTAHKNAISIRLNQLEDE